MLRYSSRKWIASNMMERENRRNEREKGSCSIRQVVEFLHIHAITQLDVKIAQDARMRTSIALQHLVLMTTII
jgi:hypothetical protein